MREILDALYNVTFDVTDESYWLFDPESACTYADSADMAKIERGKLWARLDAGGCELLELYDKNQSRHSQCENRIAFHRGLAVGLALGMLPR